MKNETLKAQSQGKSLRILSGRDYLFIIAILIMFISLFVWLFNGVLERRITSRGVITSPGETDRVYVFYDGIITDILVRNDQYVQKDDVIARMYIIDDSTKTTSPGADEMKKKSVDIHAGTDGYVSQILVQQWSQVYAYDQIAILEKGDEQYMVYSLISFENLSEIQRGTIAEVSIDAVSSDKYGVVEGRVVYVGNDIQRYEDIYAEVGNEEIARRLYENNGRHMVYIELNHDEEGQLEFTKGGYPDIEEWDNLECSISYVTKRFRPIDALFGGD